MNKRFFYFLFLLAALVSCNNDDEKRIVENARDLKKKDAVFVNIQKAWNFNTKTINPTAGNLAVTWNEWRVFLSELSQKPTSTIGAFRKKAKTLSAKASDLTNHIPPQFDKPEIKSRISVLLTKINSLNLFMNVDVIPDAKVTEIITEINTELTSLQMQMGEVTRKTQIPKEEGEADMLRMLDTSRAIPTKKPKDPALESPRRKVHKGTQKLNIKTHSVE